ncbi:MAG: hypothetical protein PHQ35_03510 [Phycisphaerae bacterium]|nr:hypothetical protein [Phycisphaerae bacterium]
MITPQEQMGGNNTAHKADTTFLSTYSSSTSQRSHLTMPQQYFATNCCLSIY